MPRIRSGSLRQCRRSDCRLQHSLEVPGEIDPTSLRYSPELPEGSSEEATRIMRRCRRTLASSKGLLDPPEGLSAETLNRYCLKGPAQKASTILKYPASNSGD